MLLYEFRIPLPLTVDEYKQALLYSTAEFSKLETGGGEGVEIVSNEPNEDENGKKFQFTRKIYHYYSKVPKMIRFLAPKGSSKIHESARNYYPYTHTVLSNPDYMKNGFHITTTTMYVADKGKTENVHDLTPEQLEKRKVITIDFLNNISSSDYTVEYDPKLFKSEKNGRGLLADDWKDTTTSYMCAYKLIEAEFKWFGIQGTVESRIMKAAPRFYRQFNRFLYCKMDEWWGLTMDQIRAHENASKQELDEMRSKGEVRGLSEK